MFDAVCARYGGRPAFTSFGHTVSYAKFAELSARFATFLCETLALPAGQRIALMLPNGLPYVIAFNGAMHAGLVVVNVNPLFTSRELQVQLVSSSAIAIVVLEGLASKLDEIVGATRIDTIIAVSLSDALPWFKRLAIDFARRRRHDAVPRSRLATRSFRSALGLAPSSDARRHVQLDDIALLQYTGGTTGKPKAVVLTHRNLSANIAQIRAWLGPSYCASAQTVVTPLPLYHVFALTASFLTFFAIGGRNVLVTDPRRIGPLVSLLKRTRPSALVGVNTLFNALLRAPGFATTHWRPDCLVIGGGAPIEREVAERWLLATGVPIIEGYGLTEASPVVSANRTGETTFTGTVGYPLASTEISVRSDDGMPLPDGQPGEFWVRGPQVMHGYWNQPGESAAALTADGWLRTGDVGYLMSDGALRIVDRKKDLIIVSGFKVFPSEVEDVARSCPGVKEAVAIGSAHPKVGQAVKLFVVRATPELNANVILDHCRANLAPYKVPHAIEFLDTLPVDALGKVLRRVLS
ncbi:AMP-dependent synthetase [Paraburkholderia sp. UYCP14C]|nr:AMP-dependent synthetase [Paraburkholderia sp. UYCP14C]